MLDVGQTYEQWLQTFRPHTAPLEEWLWAMGSPGRVVGLWDHIFEGKRFRCTYCNKDLRAAETESASFSERFHANAAGGWCGDVISTRTVGQMYDDLLKVYEEKS